MTQQWHGERRSPDLETAAPEECHLCVGCDVGDVDRSSLKHRAPRHRVPEGSEGYGIHHLTCLSLMGQAFALVSWRLPGVSTEDIGVWSAADGELLVSIRGEGAVAWN